MNYKTMFNIIVVVEGIYFLIFAGLNIYGIDFHEYFFVLILVSMVAFLLVVFLISQTLKAYNVEGRHKIILLLCVSFSIFIIVISRII